MPWGYYGNYSRPSSTYRPKSNNPWQRRGETMSLSNACAKYGVTEEQVRSADPPIDCQWRSAYGNCYPVVKCCDIEQFKRKLDKEKADKKEQALIEKYGKDRLAQMKKEEKEKQEAKVAEAKAKEERIATKKIITKKLMKRVIIADNEDKAVVDLDNVMVAKTAAKKAWFLNDADISTLEGVKFGRSTKYVAEEVIQKALKKHTEDELSIKLKNKNDKETIHQFNSYIRTKLDKDLASYPVDILEEARAEIKDNIQNDIKESEDDIRIAKEEILKDKKRLLALDTLYKQNVTAADTLANSTNRPSKASPKKKRRKTRA